jgi:chemotaxis protein CheD
VSQHYAGIGQMVISSESSDILIAPNLGSCVAVAVYDIKTKVCGMIHCLLPMSKSDPSKAQENPCLYVDTGVAKLLEDVMKKGANKKDLQIYVAGGANINDDNNIFEIGKKNYTVLKKILWKNSLLIKAEHVGDSVSRTLTLDVGQCKVSLKVKGQVFDL